MIEDFYDSDITSYDYQAPISEAGAYGQPGSGGPNKFEASRLCPSHRDLCNNGAELPASGLSMQAPATCIGRTLHLPLFMAHDVFKRH